MDTKGNKGYKLSRVGYDIDASFDKIDITFTPPYKMDSYTDPIWRSDRCDTFALITNFTIDKNALTTRKGFTQFNSARVVNTSIPVYALHRSYYLDGTWELFAHSGTAIKKSSVTLNSWSTYSAYDETISTEGTLTVTATPGVFRQFKNKTYFSNYSDPVLLFEAGSSYVHKAGIPDPNATRYFSYCEASEIGTSGENKWIVSGSGATIASDTHPAHFTQGDGGITLLKTSSGDAIATYTKDASLDFTSFSDGSDSLIDENDTTGENNDVIAIDVFRFIKDSITQLQLEFSSDNLTDFSKGYKINVYILPQLQYAALESWPGWTGFWAFSPKQDTMCAQWANDAYDNKMFEVRLEKDHFEPVGSPEGWNHIRAMRITMKAASGVGTQWTSAQITFDNIRLQKSAPICAPYRKQIANCERNEGWSFSGAGTFVDFFATKGHSALVIPTGTYASLSLGDGMDFTHYADNVDVADSDTLVLDVGGPGSTAGLALVTVTLVDGDGKTSFFVFGIVSAIKGGGVSRAKSMSSAYNWTTDSGFDWTDVHTIIISNAVGSTIFVDNIRIEPPPLSILVDKMMPVDKIAVDAGMEWAEANRSEYPVIAGIATVAGQWYLDKMYHTFGEGALTYPDYAHKQYGVGSMRLEASAGGTFGLRARYKIKRDLAHYQIMEVSPSWSVDWSNQEYGFVHMHSISVHEWDKHSIWMSSNTWQNVKSITFRLYYGHTDARFGDSTGTDSDGGSYWEYVLDYTAIHEKIAAVMGQQSFQKNYDKLAKKLAEGEITEEMAKTYLSELGFTDQEVEQILLLGPEAESGEGAGWFQGIVKWNVNEMLQSENSSENATLEKITAWEILLEAGGGDCSVAFDNWMIRKSGALVGTYWYRTVLEDSEGRQSAPSEPSRKVVCTGSSAIVTNLYVPNANNTRIKNKAIIRMGGASQTWKKIKDLKPTETAFVDELPDDKGFPWTQEYYFAPPKAKVMEIINNRAWYLNVVDRYNRVRPNRGYRSRDYCPYQVADEDAFDVRPEDGEEITGLILHQTSLVLTKTHSIWTIDPELQSAHLLRTEDFGIIAPRTLVSTNYGLIGLSHRGVVLGDITTWNLRFGDPIRAYVEAYSAASLAQAVGFYQSDHYYLFIGTNGLNNIGFDCYLPTGQWTKISGITCRSALVLEGLGDSGAFNTVIAGDSDSFVNTLFTGNTDYYMVGATPTTAPIEGILATFNLLPDTITRASIFKSFNMLFKTITDTTTTVYPHKNGVIQSALTPQTLSSLVPDVASFPFPQGIEGHTLALYILTSGRITISDLAVETWLRGRR